MAALANTLAFERGDPEALHTLTHQVWMAVAYAAAALQGDDIDVHHEDTNPRPLLHAAREVSETDTHGRLLVQLAERALGDAA